MIANNCHKCGKTVQTKLFLDADDNITGVNIRCPKCKTVPINAKTEDDGIRLWNLIENNARFYKQQTQTKDSP